MACLVWWIELLEEVQEMVSFELQVGAVHEQVAGVGDQHPDFGEVVREVLMLPDFGEGAGEVLMLPDHEMGAEEVQENDLEVQASD